MRIFKRINLTMALIQNRRNLYKSSHVCLFVEHNVWILMGFFGISTINIGYIGVECYFLMVD